MPLTGSAPALSTALRAALLATPNGGWVDNAALTGMCDAIAQTVLTHIVANALVMPTALIAPGGLSPAPVTGTGTLT